MKNKKILLTIAMIMSLVMAVSCGDTPTDSTGGDGTGTGSGGGSGAGGGTPTKTEINAEQVQTFLKDALGNLDGKFDFTAATLSDGVITSKDASSAPNPATVLEVLKTKLKAKNTATAEAIIVTEENDKINRYNWIGRTPSGTGNGTVKIILKVKNTETHKFTTGIGKPTYNTENNEVQIAIDVVLKGSSSNQWS